jgi:hypothetical protein
MEELSRNFLISVFEKTNGDTSEQVSMYDIGDGLSLDRDDASNAAAELMGLQLIDIRTLSGGIGITAEGAEKAEQLLGRPGLSESAVSKLGEDPIMDAGGRQSVEKVTAELKNRLGSLGLDFDTLSELTADLKTIDAQLGSSRPKTAIVRECLRSLKNALARSDNQKASGQILILLGQ